MIFIDVTRRHLTTKDSGFGLLLKTGKSHCGWWLRARSTFLIEWAGVSPHSVEVVDNATLGFEWFFIYWGLLVLLCWLIISFSSWLFFAPILCVKVRCSRGGRLLLVIKNWHWLILFIQMLLLLQIQTWLVNIGSSVARVLQEYVCQIIEIGC